MLFFFELALFILIMVTLALGEFVSRGVALWVWGVATVVALGGYGVTRARLGSPHPNPLPEGEGDPNSLGEGVRVRARDPLQDKWAHALLYN
jgi:hypothetical protein